MLFPISCFSLCNIVCSVLGGSEWESWTNSFPRLHLRLRGTSLICWSLTSSLRAGEKVCDCVFLVSFVKVLLSQSWVFQWRLVWADCGDFSFLFPPPVLICNIFLPADVGPVQIPGWVYPDSLEVQGELWLLFACLVYCLNKEPPLCVYLPDCFYQFSHLTKSSVSHLSSQFHICWKAAGIFALKILQIAC